MRKNVPSAMLLAAGVGSRLDPLTRQLPKPMVPFVNRPVMEHILRLLRRHGIKDVVANVHYLPHHVSSYFEDGARWSVATRFVHEQKLTGDAGGVRACREHLDNGTFVVVMGDLITDMDIGYVIRQHREKGVIATIALKQVEDVERFGVACLDENGLITGFQEKPKLHEAKSNLASTGIYVFEPEIFNYLQGDGEIGFGKQVFPRLVKEGLPVLGVEVWGYWSDVGTIEQYKKSTWDALEGLIDIEIAGLRFEHGWIGEGSELDDSVAIERIAAIGAGTRIGAGVRLSGRVVIGDHCTIHSGAVIKDSIIWPGTTIGPGSLIEDSVVGASCILQPHTCLNKAAVVEPSKRKARREASQPIGLAGLTVQGTDHEHANQAAQA